MDFYRLREFLVLSQCLSYKDAAKKLGISTSLLSKHIIALEKNLGVKLLLRSTHHVELTPPACALLRRCGKSSEITTSFSALYRTAHSPAPAICPSGLSVRPE